jgi:hypothetical protein
VGDIEHLRACPSITCLDIQENKLADPAVLDVLADMPNLAVLYLQGNPCVKRIRFYRKHVIGRLPGLKYLDDRPIFDDERSRCNVWYSAFVSEGEAAAAAAERVEIDRLAREKEEHERRNFEAFATFTRRAATGDPNAFQALQPEWIAAHGGGAGAGAPGGLSGGGGGGAGSSAGGAGCGRGAAEEGKKEEDGEEEEEGEEEEGEEEEEELEEEEGGEEGKGAESGGRGEGVVDHAGASKVSLAMMTETPAGAQARAELWGKVVAASAKDTDPLSGGGGGGAPYHTTELEELE